MKKLYIKLHMEDSGEANNRSQAKDDRILDSLASLDSLEAINYTAMLTVEYLGLTFIYLYACKICMIKE